MSTARRLGFVHALARTGTPGRAAVVRDVQERTRPNKTQPNSNLPPWPYPPWPSPLAPHPPSHPRALLPIPYFPGPCLPPEPVNENLPSAPAASPHEVRNQESRVSLLCSPRVHSDARDRPWVILVDLLTFSPLPSAQPPAHGLARMEPRGHSRTLGKRQGAGEAALDDCERGLHPEKASRSLGPSNTKPIEQTS